MRVLVVHNRYRVEGGEERSVDLQLQALAAAGIDHDLYERRSTEVGRAAAAAALLRGGDDPAELPAAVRGADVVHVHNMQPLIGPRGLEAARAAGARRGPAPAQPAPVLRDRRRLARRRPLLSLPPPPDAARRRAQLPRLAARVRRLRDRALAAPAARARRRRPLRRPQPLRRRPAGAAGAAGRPHHGAASTTCPADAFAERSRAAEGAYALVASRLSVEKGIDAAIEACVRAGVPLKIAGEGPQERSCASSRPRSPPRLDDVEFLGRVDRRPHDRAARRRRRSS